VGRNPVFIDFFRQQPRKELLLPYMKNETLIDSIVQKRWLSHLLFWAGLFSLFLLLASLNTGVTSPHFITYLATLPTQIAAAYLLNYYQIPQLLYKKRYLRFTISFLVSVYVLSALARISVVYIAEPLVRTNFEQESIVEILTDTSYLFAIYFTSTYVYAFVMMLIRTVKIRFEERHKIQLLQKEKVTNELKFLKGQIQPHFLFNTLNNLYALTLAKSDLAPQIVLKLSELLDFILYQSDQTTIPISKEIELLEGFIELESLRYGDKVAVNFKHTSERDNIQVSPLLLLPLIENAFKHGVSGSIQKAEINMNLKVTSKALVFEIYNTKPVQPVSQNLKGSGIGTANLRRQLALNYPDAHHLEIEETSEYYKVNLELNLNRTNND